MNSQCTHWVNTPLPPVDASEGSEAGTIGALEVEGVVVAVMGLRVYN
jgi:hypothetical protein